MSDPVTRLCLMRHGEVDERYHRIFGGTIDMELSATGRHQARVLAEYVERHRFDRLYCSPMKRARATADPILERQGLTAEIVEDLREIDFGEWTGKTWMAVAEEYQIDVFGWLDELDAGRVKGAESGQAFRERTGTAIRRIVEDNRGKTVAVVCHGGVVRALLSALLEIPLPHFGRLDIEYASLSVVEVSARKHEANLINLVPWRDLAVEP
jgi:broad specificity phosphatase PhoE